MTRGEFERELEQYIAQRRKAKIRFPNIFGGIKKNMPEPELPPEIEKYDEGSPAESLQSLSGEEPEKDISQKSFFTKIFETLGLVNVEQKTEEIPQEKLQQILAKDEITQDMKEIAKIALLIIKQLPPEQLSTFKASPEFEKLKELLKKHQLIK